MSLYSYIGAIVGTYDGQAEGQTLKITNCVVEETVEVKAGASSPAYVGGIIGNVHENYLSHPTTIDLSASKIQPKGSMDTAVTLKPIGSFIYGGDASSPGAAWAFTNVSCEYTKTIELLNGGTDYTEKVNSIILAAQCYGITYKDLNKYTITWVVDGKTTTEEYSAGATPSYKGSTDKASSDTTIYTFKGWTPTLAPVTADATYTAEYKEDVKIKVTWIVDGTETVEYYKKGETPNYKGEVDKADSDGYRYTFDGWDKDILATTEDITYTAKYIKKAMYTVTWDMDGETKTEVYLEGQTPSFKGSNPKKAENADYTYKFTGWDKELAPVTGDITYTAVFEKTAKNPAAADTEATEEKSGCGSMVSMGVVAVMTLGMAGAFVARKKED